MLEKRLRNMIDLHNHTTASDGIYSPSEVVAIKREMGRKYIAITDHDNMGGVEEAIEAGKEYGMTVIPGIEISCADDVHMLGYYVDHRHPEMQTFFDYVAKCRENRDRKIIDNLNRLGYEVTFEEAKSLATSVMTRLHIARALVNKGYFDVPHDAMETLLNKGMPAYEKKISIDAKDALALIKKAGGIAVLAHPGKTGVPDEMIAELATHGLIGIEAYHSGHSLEEIEHYKKLAGDLGVAITVGSDFHGDLNRKLPAVAPFHEVCWILEGRR